MTTIPATALTFWFEPASTYSYLSAIRIADLATAAGVAVAWRPFLLGPIFKAQGWTTSPFNLYPAKGRYMVRDIERIAAERRLAFRLPQPFPAASLLAARLAVALDGHPHLPDFVRATYLASFADGRDIADPGVLADVLGRLGLDAAALLMRAGGEPVKQALRDNTEAAMACGVFGAPTFTASDGELFWGDDRLEQALAWQQRITNHIATN